jgi:hypothetical protein
VSTRAILTLCGLLAGLSLAAAQPKISPSDMAGRERERFIDSPAERFMKPGPYLDPPVVSLPPPSRSARVRRAHSKKR